MSILFRNVWGSANSNLDQQRGDLFRVALNLPPALGGVSKWDASIQFAVTKFPFPARDREMVPTKYLNQTNYQLGADIGLGTIAFPVRYAFNQDTAVILERWNWMTSHPGTGAVALTSQIKCNGYFYWLIPNLDTTAVPSSITEAASTNAMLDGGAYALEGVMLKGLKPSDADMESNNNLVTLELTLQIDRYYPINPLDLQIATTQNGSTQAGDSAFNGAAGIVANAFT